MSQYLKKQKSVAVINDMSGLGRCSLTAALPIISALKVKCCPFPTAILSNQTGYESFYSVDFTPHMKKYAEEWTKRNIHFDCIMSGFLNNAEQIQIVGKLFDRFKTEDTKIIVDPVAGDDGKLYSGFKNDMVEEFKKLISRADVITPNITEACLLTDTKYDENAFKNYEKIKNIGFTLMDMGAKNVIITGISRGKYIDNCCFEKNEEPYVISSEKYSCSRSGTGDVFVSIITAETAKNVDLKKAVTKAANFIYKSAKLASDLDVAPEDGICFEEYLCEL